MSDKLKDTAKPYREPHETPPISQGEVLTPESHSQDADRKLHIRHPRSEK